MSYTFVADLSWMFLEHGPLPARYEAARRAGFTAVECSFPYDTDLDELIAAKEASGLEHIKINAPRGNVEKGEIGLAAIPNRVQDFHDSIEIAIKYARGLKCSRIHVLAGNKPTLWTDAAMEHVYFENIRYANDRLSQEGIMCLIEPVNSEISMPHYYLNDAEHALAVIKGINHPNLKMLLDIYHMQIICGNLTNTLKKYLPYTGHVQIAQVPDRHEPDTPGEINYAYVLKRLKEEGYRNYVGLEYTPKGKTEDGLGWMKTLLE